MDSDSVVLDFDREHKRGRVTFWKTGECDLEIISTENSEQLMWKHVQVDTIPEMICHLQSFLNELEKK